MIIIIVIIIGNGNDNTTTATTTTNDSNNMVIIIIAIIVDVGATSAPEGRPSKRTNKVYSIYTIIYTPAKNVSINKC